MTMTVKLDPALEKSLRRRSVALGLPASQLIREALHAYLTNTPEPSPSAYALGAGLFGRYAAAPDLASTRKQALGDAWENKHKEPGG